jgi:hypothetical protein
MNALRTKDQFREWQREQRPDLGARPVMADTAEIGQSREIVSDKRHAASLKHDPEKWKPVSRLREAKLSACSFK